VARFRKEVLRVGAFSDPVLGTAGQVSSDALALIRQSWRPGLPVLMANDRNRPGEKCGEVIGLERHGDSLVAILDVDPATSRGITAGTILGAAACLDPATQAELQSVMITNRPPVASGGYDLAAAHDQDGSLVMLSATTEEPFVSIMTEYPDPAPAQHGQIAELAVGDAALLAEAQQLWADAQADDIISRAVAGGHGRAAFTEGWHKSGTWRGSARPPVQLSAGVSSDDVTGAVAELAAARGVLPYVIEEQLEARLSADNSSPAAVQLTPADKAGLLRELVMLTAPPGEDELALSASGGYTPADVARGVDSEVARLSGVAEGIALAAARRSRTGIALAGGTGQLGPPPAGPGPAHGPVDHMPEGDAYSEHIHSHPHRHGYIVHDHDHSHGGDGLIGGDSNHELHHAGELEQPDGDVYKIPGEIGPDAAEVARIMAQHPHEGFSGGQAPQSFHGKPGSGRPVTSGTRAHASELAEDPTDTRAPHQANVPHPDLVDDILRRSGPAAGIPAPETELRQFQRRTLLGPLGPEGKASAKTPQGRAGEHPATRRPGFSLRG
jgi:hypothetical protein